MWGKRMRGKFARASICMKAPLQVGSHVCCRMSLVFWYRLCVYCNLYCILFALYFLLIRSCCGNVHIANISLMK